jgi:hypothetical protein
LNGNANSSAEWNDKHVIIIVVIAFSKTADNAFGHWKTNLEADDSDRAAGTRCVLVGNVVSE